MTGTTLLSVVFLLDIKKFHNISRLLFIASSCFFILVPSVFLGQRANAENYFLAAMLLPIMIFPVEEKVKILIGVAMTFVIWFFNQFGFFPIYLNQENIHLFPFELFQKFNFIGTFLIISIFIKHYRRYIFDVQIGASDNLVESKSFQSSILGAMPSLVSFIDENFIYRYANPQYQTVLGLHPDQMVGRPIKEVLGPAIYDIIKNPMTVAMKGQRVEYESEVVTKNGKLLAHFLYIPAFNSIEKIHGIYAIVTDITNMKKVEAQLEEAQAVAKIASWSCDLNRGDLQWSKQMYGHFNRNFEEGPLSYEEHKKYIHADDYSLWESAVQKCLVDGAPYRIRFRSVFPDKILTLEVQGRGLKDSSGKILQLLGTCQDVTELVHAETLTMLERAKSIHNAKLASLGELSAGVAHEINNPLAIIAGNLDLLPRLKADPVKFEAKILTMKKATERISKIISGLQKFSRSSESRKFVHLKISNIINEVSILVESKSKKFSTPVEFVCENDLEIFGDEIEIEQVLINLINNGIDAVKKLDKKWVQVIFIDDGAVVKIQVRDSGHGIPKDIAKNIFQPFFTTKIVGEGTGLGLSIVKGIVDDHGGKIEILENESHTCFELSFKKNEGDKNEFPNSIH